HRHLPGAPAPHGRHVHRPGAGALHGLPCLLQGRSGERSEGACARRLGGQDQDRRQRAAHQPGIGAAPRRHGHERGAQGEPYLPAPDGDRRPVRRRRPPPRPLRGALMQNKRVLLASRPSGWVSEANFRIEEAPLPQPAQGEVLVRNLWLSLDPYMRGRMSEAKSYVKGVELGEVMVGQTVGEVLESKHPTLKAGDKVLTQLGWQLYGTTKEAMRVPESRVPLSCYLGVLGMPGMTAYFGLKEIGQPKAGETVV